VLEPRGYRDARALGIAGAVGVAVGGVGLGALPVHDPLAGWPGIAELRSAPMLAVACTYLGMTLLVAAWLRIGRMDVSVRQLQKTLIWWAAPLAVVPPMYSRDVYAYIAQGAMVLRGIDPYTSGPSALGDALVDDVPVMWRDTPVPYGPVFLLLAATVVKLTGGHVVWSVLGMRLIALAGVVLIARYVPRLAQHCGAPPATAFWLGVLNPLLLVHLVAGAHNDALMIGLVVAGLTIALGRSPLAGAALIGLAILVKAPAAVALAALVPITAHRMSGRWTLLRATAGTTAVIAVVLAAVTFLSGLGYGWIGALDTPTAAKNGMSMTTNAGNLLGRLAAALGVADAADVLALFRTAGLVAAALIAGWALLRALASYQIKKVDGVWALGIALTAFVALSPIVQPWYLLWGFVPLAAAAAHHTRVRWFVVVVSIALLFYLLPFGGGPVNRLSLGALVGLAMGLFYLRLRPAGQVLQREPVPVDAETTDHPGGDGGDHRVVPELLPRVDVRDVHLDQRRVA
jgi:hypothetical protein